MDAEGRNRLISWLSDEVERQFLANSAIPPASMAASLLLLAHPERVEQRQLQEQMSGLRTELLSRGFHVLDGGNILQDMQSAAQVLDKFVRTEEEGGKSWLRVQEEERAFSLMALHYLRSCLLSVFAQDGLLLFSLIFSSPPSSAPPPPPASSSSAPPSPAHPLDRLGGVWVSREEVGRRYAELRPVWENEVVFRRGGGKEEDIEEAVVLLRRKKLLVEGERKELQLNLAGGQSKQHWQLVSSLFSGILVGYWSVLLQVVLARKGLLLLPLEDEKRCMLRMRENLQLLRDKRILARDVPVSTDTLSNALRLLVRERCLLRTPPADKTRAASLALGEEATVLGLWQLGSGWGPEDAKRKSLEELASVFASSKL